MSVPQTVKESVVIRNDSGDPVACDLRLEPGAGRRPAVVICHSFMSFKDWGFFPHVAERVAEAGFTAVSFNFSRNGVPPGADRITDFAAFSSNSFSAELADLGCVVRSIREGRLGAGSCDPGNIVLLGHSRGAGIAVSYASSAEGVAAIVTWSGIATFDRWTARQKERWRREGFLRLSPGEGEGPLRLGPEILDDLERRLPSIDPLLRAPYITAPWLILHGKADLTVPVREAESLARASGSARTKLLLLDAVGHLYNARSADEDHYVTMNHVVSLTIEWVRGVLQQKEREW